MPRLRSPKIALAALALAAWVLPYSRAGADPITPNPLWTYQTSGDVGATAGVPIGSFDFEGTSGTLLTPGSIALGQFVARDLPPGSGLTYNNLPFYITLDVYPSPPGSNRQFASEIDLRGVLNGTVTGTSTSSVTATITSIEQAGWSHPVLPLSAIRVDVPQVLAPSGINGGHTTLTATIGPFVPIPIPAPEPGTLAIFGLAGLGLLAHRVSRRRS